ncbi:MAG: DUF1566 domain-containing protein [Phycisphaerae bacterium]|nr:DUF1566 domain-containing protein [Phycisphaerae bacterium]
MRQNINTAIFTAILFLGSVMVSHAQSQKTEQCPALSYCVVSTGQTKCYDNHSEISPPKLGQPFYGQDAQFQRHPSSYSLIADGLTVYDRNTRLTWQRSPDTDGDGILTRRDKLTLTQALALPAKLSAAKFGGFDDWRLPSIKELYSLFDVRGTDPSGPSRMDTSGLTPFIDTKFFKFAYGDTRTGERVIDSQYASSTKYVGKSARGFDKLFGVNFADGRIKGYDLQMPGGMDKTFFVQCVRGNPKYGQNDFKDNTDGTITDLATGLIWSKADSGKGMNWQDALAWVQKKNAEKYLGYNNWRMPSVKELQSIVDYTRSPDTTQSAAINPLFDCTQITNEGGKSDYPFYWSGTTHGGFKGGGAAMYVAFGRASGWMSARASAGGLPDRRQPGGLGRGGPGQGEPPPEGAQESDTGNYQFTDVHGAGAQRSDPKAGDPAQFPHGRGPQGDVIRINNFIRFVRGGLD